MKCAAGAGSLVTHRARTIQFYVLIKGALHCEANAKFPVNFLIFIMKNENAFKIVLNVIIVMENEDDRFSQKLNVLTNQINLQEVKESVI